MSTNGLTVEIIQWKAHSIGTPGRTTIISGLDGSYGAEILEHTASGARLAYIAAEAPSLTAIRLKVGTVSIQTTIPIAGLAELRQKWGDNGLASPVVIAGGQAHAQLQDDEKQDLVGIGTCTLMPCNNNMLTLRIDLTDDAGGKVATSVLLSSTDAKALFL